MRLAGECRCLAICNCVELIATGLRRWLRSSNEGTAEFGWIRSVGIYCLAGRVMRSTGRRATQRRVETQSPKPSLTTRLAISFPVQTDTNWPVGGVKTPLGECTANIIRS